MNMSLSLRQFGKPTSFIYLGLPKFDITNIYIVNETSNLLLKKESATKKEFQTI